MKALIWVLLAAASAPPAGNAETIRFAAWRYGLAGQDEYYRDLAREFERANPGATVKIDLGDWNSAHEEVAGWTAGKNGPDLAIMPDVWLAEFAGSLDFYPSRFPREFLDRFQPVMLERSRYRGTNVALVWAASAKALFYRTDLFASAGLKPPGTWEDLLAAARKLNAPPTLAGFAMPGARALDTADNFYFFLWSNGGELLGPDGRPHIDTPDALEALRFYAGLVRRYKVTPANLLDCDRKCAEDTFARGQAAMIETGPWAIEAFRTAAARPPFAVVPLPKHRVQVTQLVTDHLVLFKSSPRWKVAEQFIRFSYQPEWRRRWARMGMVPELKEIAQDAFFDGDPAWRVFLSSLRDSRWIPLMVWEPIDRAIRDMLANVLAGRTEPAPALKTLSQKLDGIAQTP